MLNETISSELKNIHKEIKEIKKEIEELKEIILPTEKIPKEKLEELKKLANDDEGEFIEWNEDLDVF